MMAQPVSAQTLARILTAYDDYQLQHEHGSVNWWFPAHSKLGFGHSTLQPQNG
jgi:hypothetical protein